MLKVVVHPGQSNQRSFEVRERALTIGRAPDSEIFVSHKSLSRKHATVERRGSGLLLTDLGSRNGTLAFGVAIKSIEVKPGDGFRCGDVEFKVEGFARPPAVVFHEDPTLVSHDADATPLHALIEAIPDLPERVARKLDALIEASRIVAGATRPDEVVADLLGLLFQTFPIERTAVLLVDPIDGELRATAWKSSTGEEISRTDRDRIARRLRDVGGSALLGDDTIASAIAAPIARRGEILGALYADNPAVLDCLNEHDLGFFGALAGLVAIAIDA